jgi:hypothetical protein
LFSRVFFEVVAKTQPGTVARTPPMDDTLFDVLGAFWETVERDGGVVSTLRQARSFALALPGVTEEDHQGIPSFRVSGKIFATVPDADHIRVMVDETEIRAAAAENPDVCHEFFWGRRLACVIVTLRPAPAILLQELLTEAWLRKAPRSLAKQILDA